MVQGIFNNINKMYNFKKKKKKQVKDKNGCSQQMF